MNKVKILCDLLQGKIRVEKKSSFKNAYPLLLSSFKLPDPKKHIAKGQMCAFFASKTVM